MYHFSVRGAFRPQPTSFRPLARSRARPAFHESPKVRGDTTKQVGTHFATPHPEFAVGLVIHWILWGKAPRAVALAYDFGGLALFAAEPFFR